MAIPTFVPGKAPVIGRTSGVTYRTLDAGFGDGYSQATPDGLNAKIINAKNVSWKGLTEAELETIIGQFDSYSGTTFAYQIPGDYTQRLWRCKELSVDDSDGVFYTLIATFVLAYDLS